MPGLTKRSARDGDARKASSSKSALWMISFGASAAATAFVYPLDSVKTRMQAYREYKGVLDCIRRTYRSEGIRGFYRGENARAHLASNLIELLAHQGHSILERVFLARLHCQRRALHLSVLVQGILRSLRPVLWSRCDGSQCTEVQVPDNG